MLHIPDWTFKFPFVCLDVGITDIPGMCPSQPQLFYGDEEEKERKEKNECDF